MGEFERDEVERRQRRAMKRLVDDVGRIVERYFEAFGSHEESVAMVALCACELHKKLAEESRDG